MSQRIVLVCDWPGCKSSETVAHRSINVDLLDGRSAIPVSATVDLCREHEASMRGLLVHVVLRKS